MTTLEGAREEAQSALVEVKRVATSIVPEVERLVALALERAVQKCVTEQWKVIEHLDSAELTIIKVNAANSVLTAKAGVAKALESYDYGSVVESATRWNPPRVSLGILVEPLFAQTTAVLRDVGFDPGKTSRTVRGPLRVDALLTLEEATDAVAPLNGALAVLSERRIALGEAEEAARRDAAKYRWDGA